MTKPKLKIGLLLDDETVPSWVLTLALEITGSDYSELSLIVKKQRNKSRENGALQATRNKQPSRLYTLFMKRDKNRYQLRPDALEDTLITEKIDSPVLTLKKQLTNNNEFIPENELEQLKSFKIDVFLELGFGDVETEILKCSTYGAWAYHFGDIQDSETGPAGVWEFLKNKEVTGIALKALAQNNAADLVLTESFSSTDKFGVHRNLNNYLWKASFLVTRELKKLHANGGDAYYENARHKYPTPLETAKQKFSYPATHDILMGLFSNYVRRFKKKIDRKFNFEQYILLFKMGGENTITQKFSEFERILPPKDRFWADPFVLQKNNTHYIFIEELIYTNKLGTIGVIEMDENGAYGAPKMVLEKDYHLSYPFLIQENNALYMIPESNADKTIQLYKCVDFPLKWELEEIMMNNVQALDTTIYFHNDRYWMFTNMKEHPGISGYDELFLFYSDQLVGGNWVSHPENPVVSDVRSARPAGGIFAENGKLYRPAQNCAKRYGYGMQIAEIKTLTETEYREEIVQSIHPDWANDLRTTHTINHKGKLTVIDALIGRRK